MDPRLSSWNLSLVDRCSKIKLMVGAVQFHSVAQLCPTLCYPTDWSTPGFLVHNQLPELTQTHAHQVSDDIHTTTSSSVAPFSSCLQSFPASGSFPRSQFLTGGQNIGASASVLPVNIQDWFPLGSTGWISLQSKGLSRVSRGRRSWILLW